MGFHVPGFQEAQHLFQPSDVSEVLNPVKGAKKIAAGVSETVHPSTQAQVGNVVSNIGSTAANMPAASAGGSGQTTFGRRDQPMGQAATSMSDYLAQQRQKDVHAGLDFGGGYFGQGNPQMAAIEQQEQNRAMNGLSPEERQAYINKASQGINQQMSTGLRQLKGQLSTNGVQGGAAAGAAIPILQQANAARGAAENNLTMADFATRDKALGDYKNTVTGEREGLLGTAFGQAGLGATDRANALQYTLGQNYINALGKGQVSMPSATSGSVPWWTF